MPLHQAHPAGVAYQLLLAGCEVLRQQLLGDVPDLNLSGETQPAGYCYVSQGHLGTPATLSHRTGSAQWGALCIHLSRRGGAAGALRGREALPRSSSPSRGSHCQS